MPHHKEHKPSALHVREGVEQPGQLNPAWKRPSGRLGALPAEAYVAGIRAGDRVLLSRAITLVESKQAKHQEQAQQIIEQCLPFSGRSVRIGITGVPGVGKSTFIERFGCHLIDQGRKVAVLAIDPSSQFSKGSILGDKTRMANLATKPEAFIRPSPSGDSVGGVARKTRETIVLCEAAGFDRIIVETVGVGQSETAVYAMVDFFLLLLLPGAGDELQGIKRGIVEMADLLAINKADGDNLPRARRAMAEYRNALHFFPPKESGWIPPTVLCSAITGDGIDEILDQIQAYCAQTQASGYFEQRRQEQAGYWLHETIQGKLKTLFYHHPGVKKQLDKMEKAVLEGRLTSFQAAEQLMQLFLK